MKKYNRKSQLKPVNPSKFVNEERGEGARFKPKKYPSILPTTILILLAAATGAGLVAADVGGFFAEGFGLFVRLGLFDGLLLLVDDAFGGGGV